MPESVRNVDLIVLSHLPWDATRQQPHRLLTQAVKDRRVYYVEEAAIGEDNPGLRIAERENGVKWVVPCIPFGLTEAQARVAQSNLIDELFERENIHSFDLWYQTPMVSAFTRHSEASVVVYDSIDELSVRRRHFQKALEPGLAEPVDLAAIPHPRIGFHGAIDERIDLELLENLLIMRPDWSFVMLGPITTARVESLRRYTNLYLLGEKGYQELPNYVAGWDVAFLPWIKIPPMRLLHPMRAVEYLSAGRPVVSTAVHEVVHPYGEAGFVHIADDPADFIRSIERAMESTGDSVWINRVNAFLRRSA